MLDEKGYGEVDRHDRDLLERVRARVMNGIARESRPSGHLTVHNAEGTWEQIAPGLRRKKLFDGGNTLSALLRIDAGTTIPGHLHSMDEECLVLEGSLRIGDELLLSAGDFHLARKGLAHQDARSDTGALVYLRGAKTE